MFETDARIVEIKNYHQKLRKLVNIFIILVVCAASAYFMYYNIITNDYWGDFNYTKQYFLPLAQFLSPEDSIESNKIFLTASWKILLCAIPVVALYYILDIFKDIAIKICFHLQEGKKKKIAKVEAKNELLQYEIIKYISICISFDWSAGGVVAEDAKNKLNTGLYNKLQQVLSKSYSANKISAKKAFILKLDDFKNFDNTFTTIINLLAKIKQQIEKDNKLQMIPTITVFAYAEEEDFKQIEQGHFKILSYDFTNKALSNTLFVKKYRYLELKKYLGYSIGDYADFSEKKLGSFELNIIYDDLNKILEEIA